jgi:hypothetical protein
MLTCGGTPFTGNACHVSVLTLGFVLIGLLTVIGRAIASSDPARTEVMSPSLGHAGETGGAAVQTGETSKCRFAGTWDNFSDTWVATDALGRSLPTHEQVGPPRPDRWVGIFYFLWHGAHVNGGPYDITRILRQDPDAMQKGDSPLWGPVGAPHHWGEPLFGHYLGDDQWVLRKHAQMLADAGVDTLIFDTSNKLTYRQNYTALFDVLTEARREGNRTPDVAFLTPFWDPASTVQQLYDELYSKGLYSDLWFRWEGKPLILANPAQVNPELLDFFTFRRPQPDYFAGPTEPNMWSWLEVFPQHVFRNDRGEKEQMSVGVAQNAVKDAKGLRLGTLSEPGALGRSFHGGAHSTEPDAVLRGYNFAEQWERALQEAPKFVFVTGWNEWFGGRHTEFLGVKMPSMFVDTFNQENSRDIEPMNGGHGDNYYYQLVAYIRRFKGVRPQPAATPPTTIHIDGDFSRWGDVGPEFRDDVGDTVHRDHPGYNTVTRYVNTTGRNDLVVMKVARDADFIYFYARTREAITPPTDPSWMMLFINIDCDHTTGWHGYDFVVNRRVADAATTFVERTSNGWNWQPCAQVRFRVQGNELMLAVPRQVLGLADGDAPVRFEFKWADNTQNEDSIDEFTLNGDSAPNGRFNYLYVADSGLRR